MDGVDVIGAAEDENPRLTDAEGDAETGRPPDHPNGTAGTEGHEDMKEEEKEETLVLQEDTPASDKPPAELLARIREKNKQGLLQDYSLLGPGSRVYLKWMDRFRKKVPVPYNTPWAELILVKECKVSEGTRKIWNFAHPFCIELTGNVELKPGDA